MSSKEFLMKNLILLPHIKCNVADPYGKLNAENKGVNVNQASI